MSGLMVALCIVYTSFGVGGDCIYSWTGDKALRELQEANISQQSFPILLECATKVP